MQCLVDVSIEINSITTESKLPFLDHNGGFRRSVQTSMVPNLLRLRPLHNVPARPSHRATDQQYQRNDYRHQPQIQTVPSLKKIENVQYFPGVHHQNGVSVG
jgi:hypothetical protein